MRESFQRELDELEGVSDTGRREMMDMGEGFHR